MNKVILMGRLTRNPEVRYAQGKTPLAVAHYTLAVPRKFKRKNDDDTDFINCVAFGKIGEFAEKYLQKGKMICVSGEIRVRNYTDKAGKRILTTEVIVEEHFFTGSGTGSKTGVNNVSDVLDDSDLPF